MSNHWVCIRGVWGGILSFRNCTHLLWVLLASCSVLLGSNVSAAPTDNFTQPITSSQPSDLRAGVKEPGSDNVWTIRQSPQDGTHILVHNQRTGLNKILSFENAPNTRKLITLDLAFAPDFPDSEDKAIFICFSNGKQIQVSRFFLNDNVLQDESSIFETPILPDGEYNSAWIDFSPGGLLYISIAAETGSRLGGSQHPDDLRGKVLRINADGSIPEDNPGFGQKGGHGAVWSTFHQGPFKTNIDHQDEVNSNGIGKPAYSTGTLRFRPIIPEYTLVDGKWHMVSLPANPGDTPTVRTVLGDDINGVFGVDWIMYAFDPSSNRYVRLGLDDSLSPGIGYWIIQLTGADTELTLPEDSTEASAATPPQCPSGKVCLGVQMVSGSTSTSWNLWGLPHTKPIPWSETVVVANGCGNGCSPDQAGEKGVNAFHPQLWSFNPESGGYDLIEGEAPLAPWKGYWGAMLGNSGAELLFPVKRPVPLQVTTRQLVAKNGSVIRGRHFKCSGNPYQALIVDGDNVRIEDNLFTDCYAGIIIAGKSNTVIKGNRFVNVGLAIREKDNSSGTVITHNEFQGVGVYDCTQTPEWGWYINGYWACDVYISVDGADGKFNNNIVDNSGYQTRWIEDFVNLYGERGGFEVKDNLFIGSSEADSSSPAGGCVVIDGRGSDYDIERNACYETAGYGMASAGGSNARIIDNTIYITREHALTLSNHPSNVVPAGSFGIASTEFNGPCGNDVRVTGNHVFVHSVSVYPDQQEPVDWGEARNLSGSCPVSLLNNTFHETDPRWIIPGNVFDSFDDHYFSARRGLLQANNRN